MKKIIYALLMAAFLTSCASHSGRVCGGPGGGRVVESNQTQKPIYNQTVV